MSNQRPVRAASPQLRIRGRVDWVPEKTVDLVTAIERSTNPHGPVLNSAVPRPVNSPPKTPTWHAAEHVSPLPSPHVLSSDTRTVCHANLGAHPHVALPAPFELMAAHERAYNVDNCTIAGTPSIHAVVRKRSQQHSRVVGQTRRLVRKAEGLRDVMGPGFYGITEAPDHARPKSAVVSLAPRFSDRGARGVPDATYDSSEIPYMMRTNAHAEVGSLRSPIPRFFDPTAADAAAIRSLPLPDGTRDDFAATVSRSALAYKPVFESHAQRFDARGGGPPVDAYLRSRLRTLSQPPGAVRLGTIQGSLEDPRSLRVCSTLRASGPQRPDELGASLAPAVAALLGPGRYHEGVAAAARIVLPRSPGSIVLPLSNLPRFHERVDGYKALSLGGLVDDRVLAHRQRSPSRSHFVDLKHGSGHRFSQDAEAVNARTPTIAYRWDVPGSPIACIATAVRARTACAGSRPAPVHPPVSARPTIFTAIEGSAAAEAKALAEANKVPDVAALPLPTLPVITAASQRAVFSVAEPDRPSSTMRSRVGLLRALSVPEAQALQQQQRAERLGATQKRLRSKRLTRSSSGSVGPAPPPSPVPRGRAGMSPLRISTAPSESSIRGGSEESFALSPVSAAGAHHHQQQQPSPPVSPTSGRGGARAMTSPMTSRGPRTPSLLSGGGASGLADALPSDRASRDANKARLVAQRVSDVLAEAEPTKYLGALGMATIAELEAHQAEKTRQIRVGSPRRRPLRAASETAERPPSSPSSPGGVESPLRPDMTLAAAGLRRASTPGPGGSGERRNSDVPEALRGLPGALALAEEGSFAHLGRVSSASSAVTERRRSVHQALAASHGEGARDSVATGSEVELGESRRKSDASDEPEGGGHPQPEAA